MTFDEYNRRLVCPNCYSGETVRYTNTAEFFDRDVYIQNRCIDCDTEWMEAYHLVALRLIDDDE